MQSSVPCDSRRPRPAFVCILHVAHRSLVRTLLRCAPFETDMSALIQEGGTGFGLQVCTSLWLLVRSSCAPNQFDSLSSLRVGFESGWAFEPSHGTCMFPHEPLIPLHRV